MLGYGILPNAVLASYWKDGRDREATCECSGHHASCMIRLYGLYTMYLWHNTISIHIGVIKINVTCVDLHKGYYVC